MCCPHDIRVDNFGIFDDPAPGSVLGLQLGRSEAVPGDLVLSWTPSCGATANDYGIYEGILGSWYTHNKRDCEDDGGDLTETITPSDGDRYYLVVPLDENAEGSYGVRWNGDERPVGGGIFRCRSSQNSTPCR